MPTIIDGTGKGFQAQVDDNNRLRVESVSESDEHRKALDGEAYSINSADTANLLTITTNVGAVLHLQNDSSTKELIIQKVLVSSDAAGTIVRFVKNNVIGSIADNNSLTPANENFASGKAADVTAHSWDEVNNGIGGLSGGTVVSTFSEGVGVTVHPIDGAIILGKNNAFTLEMASTSTTDEVSAVIRFYFQTT